MAEDIDATLVIYPPVEWGGLFQRPHHLSIGLSRYFRSVFYLQPAGLRNPGMEDIRRVRGFFSASRGSFSSRIPENLKVKTLPFLPFHGFALSEMFNAAVIDRFFAVLKMDGQTPVVFWVASPAPFLKRTCAYSGKMPIVFDWMDDYSLFEHLPHRVVSMQFDLLERAGMVFASSTQLLATARSKGAAKAFLLPNGVYPDHWNSGRRGGLRDLMGESSNILGYFGTISHWIDRDLVENVAARCPELSLVFIGPRADKGLLDKVFSLRNCFHIDKTEYSKLPVLAGDFDVCWIPFRKCNATDTINPVKVYEYLAMGKPVVAPPLKDLRGLGDVVYLAEGLDDWLRAIEKGMDERGVSGLVEQRKRAAGEYSWEGIADRAAALLRDSGLV